MCTSLVSFRDPNDLIVTRPAIASLEARLIASVYRAGYFTPFLVHGGTLYDCPN